MQLRTTRNTKKLSNMEKGGRNQPQMFKISLANTFKKRHTKGQMLIRLVSL